MCLTEQTILSKYLLDADISMRGFSKVLAHPQNSYESMAPITVVLRLEYSSQFYYVD